MGNNLVCFIAMTTDSGDAVKLRSQISYLNRYADGERRWFLIFGIWISVEFYLY